MYQNSIFTEQQNDKSMELGLIGSMKDGWVEQFDFRGLTVRSVGQSIEVVDSYKRPLGGYLLLKSASIEQIHDWLTIKAEYYNE